MHVTLISFSRIKDVNIGKLSWRQIQHLREMSFSLGLTNVSSQAREALNYHY